MLHKLLRAFITILGTMALPGIVMLLQTLYGYISGKDLFGALPPWAPLVIYLLSGCASAFVFYWLSSSIASAIEAGIARLKRMLNDAPSMTLLAGGIGLIIGLIVAALFSVVISLIPLAWVSVPLTIIFYIIFGYLGATIGLERRRDVSDFISNSIAGKNGSEDPVPAPAKILDASAIIDGRIFDVIRTGFLGGRIVVPAFVLAELQHIADAQEELRRVRGRRGLDLLENLRRTVEVVVPQTDYPHTSDVDVKVVKLAREMDAEIVTTDYSLNKVASVQDIVVLNVNELANALKPVYSAGESLEVRIIRDGREEGQGVAYLEDGTMIIVDGAAGREGEMVACVVTSVLQTAAGRMIFARIQDTPA